MSSKLPGYSLNPFGQPSSWGLPQPSSWGLPQPSSWGFGNNSSSTSVNSNTTKGGFPWMWFLVGILICILVSWIVYEILKRINTRPVSESFLSMPVKGSTGIPCGQMSSEAEELYGMFLTVDPNVMKGTDLDLSNLKDLLGKLCCLKRDLMSPVQSVSSSRELQFATHMDIQPVADLTASCFAKTIPERDLSIQFDKWKDFGTTILNRLSVAASFSESNTQHAESLFKTVWQDTYNVAQETCIGTIPKGVFTTGPHDPAPMSPTSITDLGPYTGRY